MLQTLKPIEILSCTIFHFGIAALSSSGYPGAQEACIEFGLAGNPEPHLQSMPCAHSDSDVCMDSCSSQYHEMTRTVSQAAGAGGRKKRVKGKEARPGCVLSCCVGGAPVRVSEHAGLRNSMRPACPRWIPQCSASQRFLEGSKVGEVCSRQSHKDKDSRYHVFLYGWNKPLLFQPFPRSLQEVV